MYSENKLISELEINQKLLIVGDVIIYLDNTNFERFTVTDLFDGGFVAVDSEGTENVYFFSELQLGWGFNERKKTELNHLIYV